MAEKPTLPMTRTLSALVSTPANLMPSPVVVELDAVEPLEEIELPPERRNSPSVASLQADLFLLLDDLLDLAVLDRLELRRR